jgi:hypothetical protein
LGRNIELLFTRNSRKGMWSLIAFKFKEKEKESDAENRDRL